MSAVLHVCEWRPGEADGGAPCLWFRFEDGPAGPVAAETVPAALRPPRRGFAHQVLNRALAGAMLRFRPDWVHIRGLHACTLDLPRVAKLLGARVCLELPEPVDADRLDAATRAYLGEVMASVDRLVAAPDMATALPGAAAVPEVVAGLPDDWPAAAAAAAGGTDYARYEFGLRDHPLLRAMQRPYLEHFRGCGDVLDLGCGAGIFLELLAEAGIGARGVERDPAIAAYARGMGLAVETADALEYLGAGGRRYDGIYCSHFVEHLPYDRVRELMGLLAGALAENGVLVMVFPDPESIRSQLLGFWRDPEHVRFYHPDLVELLGVGQGLVCEWSSTRALHGEVWPFPAEPPPLPALPVEPAREARPSWRERLLARFGLASAGRIARLEAEVARLRLEAGGAGRVLRGLEERTDALWRVNRTWAWDDNAVLRFRKPGRP